MAEDGIRWHKMTQDPLNLTVQSVIEKRSCHADENSRDLYKAIRWIDGTILYPFLRIPAELQKHEHIGRI